MKTRTLLLLAFACGLAILIAGGIQLLRVAGDEAPPPPLAIGATGRAGDMRVTVRNVGERDGVMLVEVEVVGAEDPDVSDGFRLVVPGGPIAPGPVPAGQGTPCAAASVDTASVCTLAFDIATAQGSARVLLYERAGEARRWDLAAR